MRLLLLAASAVALSGCSALGHMSDSDYYSYAQNSYAGGNGDCYAVSQNVQVQQPVQVQQHVPTSCSHQAQPSAYTMTQPQTYAQPSYSQPIQPSYTQPSYTQPSYSQQSYTQPSHSGQSHTQHTYSEHSYVQPQVQAPTYQPQTVHNYEQSYAPSQPVYTTGNYGTHAGQGYYPQQPALRGYHQAVPQLDRGFYVQGYGGANFQHGSNVTGVSGPFTTGNIGDGTFINVADGTDYGWETDYDTGYVFGAEAGYRSGKGWRVGLEGTRSSADVDGHEEAFLGADIIDGLDGATLVGAGTPLGATIGDFLADGQGEIEQTGVFLNGYYDFNEGGRFRPYVGAGVGVVDADVTFSPSGSPILAASETLFGYQGRIGAAYNVTGPVDVFTEYTYRATTDLEGDNDLFVGDLDVDNSQSLVTVGARYNF